MSSSPRKRSAFIQHPLGLNVARQWSAKQKCDTGDINVFKMQSRNSIPSIPRRQFLVFLSSSIVLCVTNPSSSKSVATKRGLPPGAAEQALKQAMETYPLAWPYIDQDFKRYDMTSDENFYSFPRLTRHIDDSCTKSLSQFYSDFLLSKSLNDKSVQQPKRILDLCSSIESYLPSSKQLKEQHGVIDVIGLGMNEEELKQNPSLTSYFVQDLNRDYKLKTFDDQSVDVILCALSIDYLIYPQQLFMEFSRILKPDGVVVIAFSDRIFSEKAINLWINSTNQDHVYIIASYFYYTRNSFKNIQVFDISPRSKFNSGLLGDPLYVVTAQRCAS